MLMATGLYQSRDTNLTAPPYWTIRITFSSNAHRTEYVHKSELLVRLQTREGRLALDERVIISQLRCEVMRHALINNAVLFVITS